MRLKIIMLCCIVSLGVSACMGAPNQYNQEIPTITSDLRGKLFTDVSTGMNAWSDVTTGNIYISSVNHRTNAVVKIRAIAILNSMKNFDGSVNVVHRNDAGVMDGVKRWTMGTPDAQGFVYLTTDFTTVCVGCASGGYTQAWNTNQTNSSNNTIAIPVNGSVLTSSTISIQDAKTCSTLTSLYNCVNTTGLVGHWRMDETTGTLVQDFSGNGNNGTWIGGSGSINSSVGKINNGFVLDNGSDYVKILHNTNLKPTSAITVSAWINPTNYTLDGTSAFSSGRNSGMIMFYPSGTNIRFYVHVSGWKQISVPKSSIPFGVWSQYTLTYNGSAITLYMNGVYYSKYDIVGTITSGTDHVLIGAYANSQSTPVSTEHFNGTIDEARIYNRSLSAEEIRQDYLVSAQSMQAKYTTNSTWSSTMNGSSSASLPYLSAMNPYNYGGDDTGLVLDTRMEETTGTTLADSSGMGNHGTWNGNTTLNTTTGILGNALSFDGVNDYVTISNLSSVNYSTITLSGWIKANDGVSSFIISKDDSVTKRVFQLGKYSTNKIRLILWDATGTIHTLYSDNVLLSTQFYHVVGTYDGTTQKLYLNGVQQSTTNSYTSTVYSAVQDVYIGKQATNYANGSIDDVRIYNRSLSAEEIRAYYENSSTRYNTIEWQTPVNITDDSGNTCYGCNASMQFNPTLTLEGMEDTISISETIANGWHNTTMSWIPSMFYNSTWVNFTVTDPWAQFYGTTTLQSNNATATLQSSTTTTRNINISNVTEGAIIYFNTSQPYNNYPVFTLVPLTEYGLDQNITSVCAVHDYESNPLEGYVQLYQNYFEDSPILISNQTYNTTFLCQQIDFGTLPYGSYSLAPFVGETSNTVSPLLTGHPHYNFNVVCFNCTLSGTVTNELGVTLLNARVYVGSISNLTNATGYYFLSPVGTTNTSAMARAIGYMNNTQAVNVTGNTVLDFVMLERIPSTEAQVLDAGMMGLIGGIFGAIIIVGIFRRKRKE